MRPSPVLPIAALPEVDYKVMEPAAQGDGATFGPYRFAPFPEGKHIEINQLESWELKRHLVSSMTLTLDNWSASGGLEKYKNAKR
jgi:hypothetical protein